MRRELGK